MATRKVVGSGGPAVNAGEAAALRVYRVPKAQGCRCGVSSVPVTRYRAPRGDNGLS